MNNRTEKTETSDKKHSYFICTDHFIFYQAEFWTQPDDQDNRLKGSGLLILNPPWKLDQQLTDLLPALAKGLNTNEPTPMHNDS